MDRTRVLSDNLTVLHRRTFVLILAFALHGLSQQKAAHPVALIGISSEIAPVEARLMKPVVTKIQGVVFTAGILDGASVVTARSGAGKVNAAFAATLLVDHFQPSAVVFTGTAGAIDPELNPGDVIIGTAVGYHDFGDITSGGFVRSQTRDASSGRLDPSFFPADPALLAAARRATAAAKLSAGANVSPHVREGRIVTGDAFVANAARRNDLRRELNASAVEMEGAAVAQVCARFGVPMIIVRSITDRADGGAPDSYERFVGLASRNAAELAVATVHEMMH